VLRKCDVKLLTVTVKLTISSVSLRRLTLVSVIPCLHDEAGSTSWLVQLIYVSWTSQLDDVCF